MKYVVKKERSKESIHFWLIHVSYAYLCPIALLFVFHDSSTAEFSDAEILLQLNLKSSSIAVISFFPEKLGHL